MTSHLQLISYGLWFAHPVLQFGLIVLLLRRKLHRNFPLFFAYVVAEVVIFLVLFPILRWGGYAPYFYAYWISEVISLILGFEVIHEIFMDVFRPYHTLKDMGSVLFKWAALVMILVAAVVASASPAGQQGPLVQAVTTVHRCIRVIQCGLILFLLLFSKYLGVSRRQHSFGIALGLGAFAGTELAMVALNASGHASQAITSLINMAAYNAAVLTWLAYVWQGSSSHQVTAKRPLPQRWDMSLTDLQRPAPSDSLIPLFEGMVERALSRTHCDPLPQAAEETESVGIRKLSSSPQLSRPIPATQLSSKT